MLYHTILSSKKFIVPKKSSAFIFQFAAVLPKVSLRVNSMNLRVKQI